MRTVILAPLLLFIPGLLAAHDFWIEPDGFRTVPGAPVNISLREGVGFKGNTLPYITQWFNDFSITSQNGRSPVISELGNDPAAALAPEAGAYLLGYQSNANFVELDPAKFESYLLEEGMEYILARRAELGEDQEPAPENFVRCAKTLIAVGVGQSQAEIYAKILGYSLELVPDSDPLTVKPGDRISFRVLYEGKPVQGILVRALSKDRPEQSIDVRSDEDGQVSLRLPRTGVWMVKAVHLVELDSGRDPELIAARLAAGDDPPPKWESYWATYLFQVK